MTAVYTFKKPGFKARQSAKLKNPNARGSILVSCDLNDDHKVGLIHTQKDYTLLPTYLEILFNLDTETESWEISIDAFKDWFRKRFDVNNRFDIEKRLEWLSNVGLIVFKRVPNEILKGEKIPLEQAETPVPVISGYLNQPTNQHTPLPPNGGVSRFDDFWEIWPNKVDRIDARKVWHSKKLDPIADKIIAAVEKRKLTSGWKDDNGKYIPGPAKYLRGERWEDQIDGVAGPNGWSIAQLANFEKKHKILSHQKFMLNGVPLARGDIVDIPERPNHVLIDGIERLAFDLDVLE